MIIQSISNQSLPAGTRIEEFVIERVLGSGGFGITYLARDVRLDRQVVIKENLPVQFCFRDTHSLTVAPRHTTGEDVENFKWSLENFSKESAMLASLDHPGIVKVLRSFEALGTAYFVMPFVEGLALDELAKSRQGKPFNEEELRGLLERMLDALGYLHDRGIYHRDIKPGNILITNDGIPVLIDFGSARQRLSERSMTVVESAGYTPFEQLQSRGNVGPWSDFYALGGTLVKTIIGEAPPKANDRMRKDPFLPMSERAELVSRFSKDFLRTLDRALAMDEEDRWQNAGGWLLALRGDGVVESSPSVPPTVENRSVFSENSKRTIKPLPWILAACVILGILVLGAWAMNQSSRKLQERAAEASNDAAIQRERDKTQAEGAEQRAAQAEKDKQILIDQAKAKEEADTKAKREMLSAIGNKAGEKRDFDIAPGVKISMCWIPPGEFMMGSPASEAGRLDNETQHRVTISKGFWLAKTEATQAQWQAVMGSNPSDFKGDDLPVECVSWNDIAGPGGFIEKVNQAAASGGGRFSLPTEAQWEYACRAGTTGAYAGDLDQVAWYDRNSGGKTHPVGGKKANDWGLQDMHGNVVEWCADSYRAYPDGAATDPNGDIFSGSSLVYRGGYFFDRSSRCRAAYRDLTGPSYSGGIVGFRVARSPVP